MSVRMIAALASAGLLAACGGGGGGDGPPSFQERLETTQAVIGRVDALDPSSDAAVPETGTARFTGVAVVGADTDPFDADEVTTALIGDARIDANFGTGRLAGGATDFFGRVEGGDVRAYAGTLTLSDGTIGAGGPPNALDGRLAGSLSGGGDVIGVDAPMAGTLLGDPRVRGLEMFSGAPGVVTINGVPVFASAVAVGAERR